MQVSVDAQVPSPQTWPLPIGFCSISRGNKSRTIGSLQKDTDLSAEPGIGPNLAYLFRALGYIW